ncbi:hypothetical protein J437_LFUL006223 [Ladona fulva]|uniref:LNR domain-containing protein n=1 Tax=Ladona fulva TaxID=123851 RepID=A0A8K0P1M1_LADFU|nr:hypothetical protein J437_LFUL006223 [Ladona fulva]
MTKDDFVSLNPLVNKLTKRNKTHSVSNVDFRKASALGFQGGHKEDVGFPYSELIPYMTLSGNLTIQGKAVKVHRATLVLELSSTENLGDFSPSRFDDKEELRYSLRSVEQFAPWVRHIWLVTNGQIPHWINLEHPRLTLITHDEIFLNVSHLPTFGSPAIESHLHRIPGLSEKFLYLNDDMLFGKEVWPDDFYTAAYGQKVYLSWPVPECHEGCPPLWIGDGYCDRACNHSECHWDGGDCLPGNEASRWMSPGFRPGSLKKGDGDGIDDDDEGFQRGDDDGELWGEGNNNDIAELCGPHCTDSWLADKYCDINCNNMACGFDAGDCGTSHFHQMAAFDLLANVKTYHVPSGALSVYWNLTNFMKDGSEITHGEYTDSKAVRVMALSIKLFTITLVLKPGYNDTVMSVSLKGKKNRDPIKGQKETLFEKLKSSAPINSKTDTVTANLANEKNPLQITPFAEGVQLAPKVLMREKAIKSTIHSMMKVLHSTKYPDFSIKQARTQDNQNDDKKEFKARSLKSFSWSNDYVKHTKENSFPKIDFLHEIQEDSHDEIPHAEQRWRSRRLQDSFADSLLYVNRLYDKAYGLEARKVPAHMAHLIDKKVMEELQARFPKEWDETSSHKVRSPHDMQYAFSYFYFLMSEKTAVPVSEIFDNFDTDHSGTWSDREIRTVLARIYDHPLTYDKVLRFERSLINCSNSISLDEQIEIPSNERYLDSKLPVVTKALIIGCQPISETLTKKFGKHHRFKYQVVGDEEVAFKMLNSDINSAIAQLDDIRKKPRKFVCLNDNLDPQQPKNNDKVRILLKDLFEALYPKPSSFELPPEYRNRFLKMSELREWRAHHTWLRIIVYISIAILITFSLTNFFHNEVIRVWKKLLRHPRSRRIRGRSKTKDITFV